MKFDLVDRVLEQAPGRIVTLKQVTAAEEYLQDHFASFPVLPGVLMLEAMVQAGRRLLDDRARGGPLVLGRVRALKYGRFVRPGAALRIEVALQGEKDGTFDLKGEATLIEPGSEDRPTAASGRFTLRPVRPHASLAGA
ncbi:MAG: polyketide synthase dehydratase domain-containing protein [Phycisphaerales bacterium]|nr:polyketide synthase dehydratase domain-containing protein [Phycisphaerales bacterium]